MLAVLISLTPSRRKECIDSEKVKVCISVIPIMDVKTLWNSIMEVLERSNLLREFTREWIQNPKYAEYQLQFTSQDQWRTGKCVIEVLMPFRYWTLWMLKRHTFTFHHMITVYKNMFDHMDGVTRALAKKMTQWKEELFFAVMLARQKISKYSAEVSPTMGMLLISVHILDPCRKLRLFR
jgi:hypothetical protein